MNTLTYKGYMGSVNFSEKDSVFFGKIEGIDGLVNFEGESVKELTEAFHEAVDDYWNIARQRVLNHIKAIPDRLIFVLHQRFIVVLPY